MLEALQPMIYTKLFWITTVIVLVYLYLKLVVYSYWKRKGVAYEAPIIPFGNALPLVVGEKSLGNLVRETYEKHKQHRFHGIYMFHQPILMINDPEIIRLVLIKEFSRFRDRGLYYNEDVDPLSGHLFLLPGEQWRKLRAKLSPTFTSGKLKQMFPLVKEIGDELVKICEKTIEESPIIEFKNLIASYTTDSISSIAFGFNCNSLNDPKSDFKRHGAMVFDQNPLKNALGIFAPIVLDTLRIPLMHTDVISFFSKIFQDTVKHRRQNKIERKDFINLLMQLMDKGELEEEDNAVKSNGTKADSKLEKVTMKQAQAQAFVFFVAGFETASSTITYCLYELAKNPEIQEKLHAEIDSFTSRPEGVTYDSIMNEFEYLHMVFSETLRKHPSVPMLNRLCLEDCDIPNSDYKIKKGTGIMISVTGLHRDPNIYPDPDAFDPLRFSKESVAARSPYVYLPFGDGPRVCIGARFGILQSKIALIVLLSKFKFSICDQTPVPIRYSIRAITQTPEGGVYLRMTKRNVK